MDSHRPPQARAITYEEWKRGGGGGEPPQRREPTRVEQAIRDWALRLIKQEEAAYETEEKLPPKQYVEFRARKGDLRMLFNSIKYNPEISGTLKAVETIWDYRFGLRRPGPV